MNEELKKEVRERLDKVTHKRIYLEPFIYRKIIDYIAEDIIDQATLAERKRCAEIVRQWKNIDDEGFELVEDIHTAYVKQEIATAIEKGEV